MIPTEHDKNRFYASAVWKRTSKFKLNQAIWCECDICSEYGFEIPATEVHHIEGLELAWDKRLQWDNLMSVSHEHHTRLTMKERNDTKAKQNKVKGYDPITERLLKVTNTGGS